MIVHNEKLCRTNAIQKHEHGRRKAQHPAARKKRDRVHVEGSIPVTVLLTLGPKRGTVTA